MSKAGAVCPDPQHISEAKQASVLPKAIRKTKEVSGAYGEQHHFLQAHVTEALCFFKKSRFYVTGLQMSNF